MKRWIDLGYLFCYHASMNKLHIFSIVLGISVIVSPALATVGGPTFIHTLKYNPLDESVYYIQNSESGRGCPPGLMKISKFRQIGSGSFL